MQQDQTTSDREEKLAALAQVYLALRLSPAAAVEAAKADLPQFVSPEEIAEAA